VGTTNELGAFGYISAALQIMGFALGGLLIFLHLSSLPYCMKCSKYLKSKATQLRYSADPENFAAMVKDVASHFENGRLQQAIDTHGNFGAKNPGGGYLSSTLARKQCSICAVNWLQFSAQKLIASEWKDIKELQFAQFHQGELNP
jgi:hypothetical protein